DGLFTPRFELVLMALAWMILALISVPIARAAYGPLAGGSLHLYAVLLAGALLLALDRWLAKEEDDQSSRDYWLSFAVLLLLALLLPLLINASGLSGVALPRYLGSIAILYTSLSIFTVFASSFFLFGTNSGVPLLSLLLVGALALASFRINDNHAVRLLAGPGTPALPDLHQSFVAWLNQDGRREAIEAPGAKGKWPIYVVSAQGGGIYAAYHSAKALALLSSEVPAFPNHLFALSGVSGGSVGSALYVNALHQATSGPDLVERIDQTFEQDHLSPVLASMLFQDATQRFYPVPVPAWDRALGLELSFSDGGGQPPASVSLEGSFYSDPQAPFLVLNTTEVQSGRRLLLSPFHFDSDSTFHLPDGEDVRFSTAAVMSARFPLITPYAFFSGSPEQRQRRTVDGGYYDNSGAVTAEELVQALNQELINEKLDQKAEVIPIAIVGISNFLPQPATDNEASMAASSANKPLLSFSALDALFAAREARVDKALDDFGVHCGKAGDQAGDKAGNKGLCITLQTKFLIAKQDGSAQMQQPRDIPLGWSLSCHSRQFISQQLAVDGTLKLPCLNHQGSQLNLMAAGPVAGEQDIPSFAKIVEDLRSQVNQAGAPSGGGAVG
ncbi:MAG: hypothetical protein VKO44_11215, partial [Cyanobacteriota bacterium]|nr:hypothetical protein [Cyanobacteriota bacterium]